MNELVIMKDQQAVTSSLQVAEVFGKQHKNVLRDIDNLNLDRLNFEQMFSEGNEDDSYGRDRKVFYMNRDGFTLLAMGFTGKKALDFKLEYIDAFNQMEKQMVLPKTPMEALELMFKANKSIDRKVDKVGLRVTELEDNQSLKPGEYNYVSKRIRQAVNEYISVHNLVVNRKQRSKLYSDISRGMNEVTGIRTRTQLRKKDFETAIEFINNWQPSTATIQIIKQMGSEAEGQTNLGM